MYDLVLYKQNEAFLKFDCEKSVAQELADYFTFFVPGYQFMPAYKNKLWDGRNYVAEGCITDEIRNDLQRLGWAVAPDGDWKKFV